MFPGIAVAEELKKRHPEADVLFIGSSRGIESRAVPAAGYQISFIPAEGFVGKSALSKIRALIKLGMSFTESRSILKSFRPDVVVGTGGYASAGPVVAASTMSIPTMIMEQNLVPGLANKLLGRFADAVAVTYHESLAQFPRPIAHLTGNPVRASILKGDRLTACRLFGLSETRLTVFILGGSAGARSINNIMVSALNRLLDMRDGLQFLHQTGEHDYQGVRKAYRQLGFTAMAAPFINEMAEAYAMADLVISRAGATTIAEITALGKPSILIPYPHAGGHQEFNARKLLDSGAAKMFMEEELDGDVLASAVREICASDAVRSDMRTRSRAAGRPEAASKAVDIIESIAKGGKFPGRKA